MDRERLRWLMAEGEEEEEEEKQTPRGVTARAGSSGSDAPSCAHVYKVGFRQASRVFGPSNVSLIGSLWWTLQEEGIRPETSPFGMEISRYLPTV